MDLSSDKQAITIGIFGSNGKTSTVNLLNSMFYEAGLSVNIFNDENNVADKRNMANNEIYNKLKKFANNDIIIIEITKKLLESDNLKGINFDILIHTHISQGSYEDSIEGKSKINSIINCSNSVKSVILNTDDVKWKDIIIDLENIYLMTYGLGNKATVTASSIECSRNIKFCYCLQRSIPGYNGGFVEPMELPMVIKAPGQYNVYNGLAAITAALICGINLDVIQSSMNRNPIQNTGVKLLYENGFGVADNVCDTIMSFETGFETIQNFNYDNVHLIFDLDNTNSRNMNRRILEIIVSWSMVLYIKKIYLINSNVNVILPDLEDSLNNLLDSSKTTVSIIEGTAGDIACIINSLRGRDILLIFCSSQHKQLRECVSETLDKLILGELRLDVTCTKF